MQFISKHSKSLFYGAILGILTYFVHNPLYDSCTLSGCNYGRGFPLPFYFEKFCAPGDANCIEGYFSGATFVFDLALLMLICAGLESLYGIFFGNGADPGDSMYKIRT